MNGMHIYIPSSVSYGNDNIVGPKSGRSESGKMRIFWVRPTVRTIKLTYDKLTGAEKDLLHTLMQGKEFTLTYFDNGIKTVPVYGGKDEYTLVNIMNYKDEGGEYKDYSINLIEM